MSLSLVKTIKDGDGGPSVCRCGHTKFIESNEAWYCSKCGNYYPTILSLRNDVKNVIRVLEKVRLHVEKTKLKPV